MTTQSLALRNLILAGLPSAVLQRMLPELEPTALPSGRALYSSGEVIEHVYFPCDGLVSLVTHMNDGSTVEVGLIGRGGMVGIPVLLGSDIAFEEAVVQIPGTALRMSSQALKAELRRKNSPLLTLLLLYTRALMKQVAQTAACNGRHTAEKRLARWLLMCRDEVGSDELPLTQEFISNMLGVRRASVGGATSWLQAEGFIRHSRGRVRILRGGGLEEFTCECYHALAE